LICKGLRFQGKKFLRIPNFRLAIESACCKLPTVELANSKQQKGKTMNTETKTTETKQRGYREYIDATQRGFAYGLIDIATGNRVVERCLRCDSNPEAIDKCYKAAQKGAYLLLSTVKRGHKRLIRDWGNVSGPLY